MHKKLNHIFKWIIIIVTICVLIYLYSKTFIFKTTYLDYVENSCKGTGIDPYLVLSIIRVESGFNPNAKSSKEAKGLMQITDTTYSDVSYMLTNINSDIDAYDPETNIKIGVTYFKYLIKKYDGNYYIALLAYNAGMGNVDNWISKGIITNDLNDHIVPEIPFNETKNYLRKVITTYHIYKLLYHKII